MEKPPRPRDKKSFKRRGDLHKHQGTPRKGPAQQAHSSQQACTRFSSLFSQLRKCCWKKGVTSFRSVTWNRRFLSHLSLLRWCTQWCQEINPCISLALPWLMLGCFQGKGQTTGGSSVLRLLTTLQCSALPCVSLSWFDVLPSTAQLLGNWQHPRRWLSGASSPALAREGNTGRIYVPASWRKHLSSLG